MINHTSSKAQAFSLVEISVVLVVIGLLVGGVLAGQSLIRSAQLKEVVTEYEAYRAATIKFQDKYMAIPGDYPDATTNWGELSVCGGSDAEGVCNGNGNGTLHQNNDLASAASQEGEPFQFWRHLSRAGMIKGDFTGIAGSSNKNQGISGENQPSGALPSSGWGVSSSQWTSGNTELFDGYYGIYFVIGGDRTAAAPTNPVFKTKEAKQLDAKIDDGMPATGRVVATIRELCTTATSAASNSDNFDADYNGSITRIACSLTFRQILKDKLIK